MSLSTGSSPSSRRNSFRNDSFIDEKDAIDSITSTEMGCLSLIVLGASGDLAKKKTFPALFNLFRQVCPMIDCKAEFIEVKVRSDYVQTILKSCNRTFIQVAKLLIKMELKYLWTEQNKSSYQVTQIKFTNMVQTMMLYWCVYSD